MSATEHQINITSLDGCDTTMEVGGEDTWLAVKQNLSKLTGQSLEAMVFYEASQELPLEGCATVRSSGMPSCIYLAADEIFVAKQLTSELLEAGSELDEVVDQLMDESGLNLSMKQVCLILLETEAVEGSSELLDCVLTNEECFGMDLDDATLFLSEELGFGAEQMMHAVHFSDSHDVHYDEVVDMAMELYDEITPAEMALVNCYVFIGDDHHSHSRCINKMQLLEKMISGYGDEHAHIACMLSSSFELEDCAIADVIQNQMNGAYGERIQVA
jgi:hypothetical protein